MNPNLLKNFLRSRWLTIVPAIPAAIWPISKGILLCEPDNHLDRLFHTSTIQQWQLATVLSMTVVFSLSILVTQYWYESKTTVAFGLRWTKDLQPLCPKRECQTPVSSNDHWSKIRCPACNSDLQAHNCGTVLSLQQAKTALQAQQSKTKDKSPIATGESST